MFQVNDVVDAFYKACLADRQCVDACAQLELGRIERDRRWAVP